MTRSRGYHSYRGRTPKWKVVLAIVLVLVILGAVGFMVLQEHIVYDGTGTPHLRLPQQETEDTGTPPEEEEPVEVVIQEPEGPQEIHAFSLPAQALTQQTVEAALAQPQAECNAVAVTLKDSAGLVYFDAAGAVSGTVRTEADTTAALEALTGQEDLYTVARISCFHDPKAANAEVESMGLKNTGGYIFYDGNNSQWLDPGHEKARTYLLNIIREAVEQGFREIILTDVSYPTAGKLDKIDFSNAMTAGNTAEAGRQVQIEGFLREVRDALPKNVILSLELPAETILAGTNSDAGQELGALAPLVDRIYAETTEAEAPALETAVKAASAACGFVPELTEQPAEGTENWLLIQK